jgi:hypothetical protein
MRAVESSVVVGSDQDVADLAQLSASYTWDSPLAAWLVPDAGDRPGVLLGWYTILIEQAVSHGYADVSKDRRAAAIWLDHTMPLPAPPDYLRRLTSSCGQYTAALLRYGHIVERYRPRAGHVELVLLAANERTASRLLAYRHRRLDEAMVCAYAVARDVEQGRLLAAAGYQAASTCRLPGGPDLVVMVRRPFAAAAAAAAAAVPPSVVAVSEGAA